MIAKGTKGKSIRGVLVYILAPEKGVLLDTNMDGATPAELAAEFRMMSDARRGISKPVFHVSLSAAPGDQLTKGQWREIGQRYLAGMGFTDHQYVLIQHTDTEHDHVHIVTNRIGYDGSVASDSYDRWRGTALMRVIERDYSLRELSPPRSNSHPASR